MSDSLLEPLPEPELSVFDLTSGSRSTTLAPRCAAVAAEALRIVEVPSGTICAVCLELLGQTCVRLPCAHVFHRDCVVPWLAQRGTCPNCRAELCGGSLAATVDAA